MALPVSQCVVCCHESSTWSIGACDHPICLTCSARLRVLCEQTACPVCRVDLKQVSVTNEVKPFAVLAQDVSQHLCDRKHGFVFQSASLRGSYEAVLSHRCGKCAQDERPFRDYNELRDHARRAHGMFYCDICLANLKLFPQEHKTYTRPELATHRREGDPDDTSHKGHPLCQFCDDRFLDNDALLHHLRTVHQWCHVCEGLGKGQNYYADYHSLRLHFKKEHFLCEEGHCRHAKNTSVFATKIDIQAHRAAEHSSGLSKAEVKQLKQIEVGFTYNRRGAEDIFVQRAPPRSRAEEKVQEEADVSAALHASRYTASEEFVSSKRTSPTLHQATDGTASVRSTDTTTTSRGSNKKHTSGSERKYKDNSSLSSDQKTSSSLVDRVQENRKPQKGIQDSVPSSLEAAGREMLACEDVKMASSTSRARKPPGFENVVRWPEVPSLTQETTHPLQKVTPVTPVSTPAAPDNRSSLKVSRQAVPPSAQDDWPSLNAQGAPEEAKSRNTLAPPGFQQPSAKASMTSKVQASVESRVYEEFRTLCGNYASGKMLAHEYHARCWSLLGEHTWNSLGPELARTLPDESKQRELLAMFPRSESAGGGGNRSMSKGYPRASRAQKNGVWASRVDRNLCDEKEFPSLQDAVDLPDYPQQAAGWSSRVMGTAT